MRERNVLQKLVGSAMALGLALFAVGLVEQCDGKTTVRSGTPVAAVWNPASNRFEGTYVLHNGRLTAWDAWPFPTCSCEVTDLPATLLPLSDHVVRFSLRLNRESVGTTTVMTIGSSDRRYRIAVPTVLTDSPVPNLVRR